MKIFFMKNLEPQGMESVLFSPFLSSPPYILINAFLHPCQKFQCLQLNCHYGYSLEITISRFTRVNLYEQKFGRLCLFHLQQHVITYVKVRFICLFTSLHNFKCKVKLFEKFEQFDSSFSQEAVHQVRVSKSYLRRFQANYDQNICITSLLHVVIVYIL